MSRQQLRNRTEENLNLSWPLLGPLESSCKIERRATSKRFPAMETFLSASLEGTNSNVVRRGQRQPPCNPAIRTYDIQCSDLYILFVKPRAALFNDVSNTGGSGMHLSQQKGS